MPSRGPNKQRLAELYALPAPLRTFPLPAIIPHNPVSWLHVAYVWLRQFVKAQDSHMESLYLGTFSAESRSVHITEHSSIRGLWEQGFYGKGTLSRSEPSWMLREQARNGPSSKVTSEDITRQRRAERQQTKWERARKERETIDQRILEELDMAQGTQVMSSQGSNAQASSSQDEMLRQEHVLEESIAAQAQIRDMSENLRPRIISLSPVASVDHASDLMSRNTLQSFAPPVGPSQLLALPNSFRDLPAPKALFSSVLNSARDHGSVIDTVDRSCASLDNGAPVPAAPFEEQALERRDEKLDILQAPVSPCVETASESQTGNKSVRFASTEVPAVGQTSLSKEQSIHLKDPNCSNAIQREHLQLTFEEAFFLAYGLGALKILDPESNEYMSTDFLFSKFRAGYTLHQKSLIPDGLHDEFVLSYVVYHHFRSLGWVVRSGMKFSVDFLLYAKGPVFTHAEFAVIILPSFSDEFWSSTEDLVQQCGRRQQKAWSWLHSVNRVITQVRKTLLLVYVDVPPPLPNQQEKPVGITGCLRRYRIREVALKRWSANRSRD